MSRVLFLDVDGVLNHLAAYEGGKLGPTPIDPACVALLHDVAEKTGAHIVLSSAWRGLRGLEEKLHREGALKHAHPTDWQTPQLSTVSKGGVIMARVRGDEIADWLSRHPEVDRYAIVDDDSDMLPEQMPYFVKTDFHNGGLTRLHADMLIEILSDDPVPASPAGVGVTV